MNTLQLDANWDLLITDGTLTVATGGYALAQDVASECRTFRGECWYDTTRGLPYYQLILGKLISIANVKQLLIAAGMRIPGVGSIVCYLTGPSRGRDLGGQLQVYSSSGALVAVTQGPLVGVAPWWVNAAPPEAT